MIKNKIKTTRVFCKTHSEVRKSYIPLNKIPGRIPDTTTYKVHRTFVPHRTSTTYIQNTYSSTSFPHKFRRYRNDFTQTTK